MKSCGTCKYWDRSNKVNCSVPESPVYYSECLFEVDWYKLPYSISTKERMSEDSSNKCPCWSKHETT